ncbi:MAG: FAD-dependent thymidylate synthase [Bacteriovoracaceae bacterium]|nr:FAD-dependent thymidylate synthase [Bacteriovoracaceae bacterium]
MNKIKCLDHGFVKLIDHMGDDQAVVQAARVSYGDGTKTATKDRGLIRYLMRHRHTSPFEMVSFKFHCKMPIFIARQWVRHRTASINEISGRYSILPEEQYVPEKNHLAYQSTDNKQGRSDENIPQDVLNKTIDSINDGFKAANRAYHSMLDDNIAREIARISLPLSQYTEWYWKMDLHNLLHFLQLRLHAHAQYEIRVFAEAIMELIKPIVPISYEAFDDYILNSHTFSGAEMSILRGFLKERLHELPTEHPSISKRELQSFKRILEDG